MTQYFDSNGTYKAYTIDGKNLFNDSEEHIGYFLNSFLYDNKGQAIGHIRNKKILNKQGQTLYYTNWISLLASQTELEWNVNGNRSAAR